jgi:hypothetical protein
MLEWLDLETGNRTSVTLQIEAHQIKDISPDSDSDSDSDSSGHSNVECHEPCFCREGSEISVMMNHFPFLLMKGATSQLGASKPPQLSVIYRKYMTR